MKRFQQGLLAILMVGLMGFTPSDEGEFEGTFTYLIKQKNPDQNKTIQLEFFIKGEQTLIKMKREQSPNAMKMMIDKAQSNFFVLMNKNDQKIAMKQGLEKVRSMSDKASKMDDNSIEKTGKTKTIKGYECTLYKIDGEKYKGDAWITDELALSMKNVFNMMQQNPSGAKQSNSMFPNKYPENGVTMKSNMENKNNDKEVEMVMKSVDEKTVSEDHFDISDYRVMDVSGATGSPNK